MVENNSKKVLKQIHDYFLKDIKSLTREIERLENSLFLGRSFPPTPYQIQMLILKLKEIRKLKRAIQKLI